MQIKNYNVVAIGGGHGLGRVLSTLSFLGNRLTGIVATTDNGGSTGKLRKRTSTIAWGDLRNCLTQLVDDNSVASQLFNFRFDGKDELEGHNIGNLIFYALNEIQSRPIDSLKLVSSLLGIKTQLLPMSEIPTDLMAFYEEGRCRVGEVSVDDMKTMPINLMLAPLVKPTHEVVNAIEKADLVILGPGSFLTSVVPPLLVRDITTAIVKSNAHCVFIDNLVKEDSPAGHINLDQKLEWLKENLGMQPIDSVITENLNLSSKHVNIIKQELTTNDEPNFHNKEKLIDAIEQCIATQLPSLVENN